MPHSRNRCIYIYIISILFTACSPQKKDISRPNIIIIMADDLGWADVGYNGNTFFETPYLDQLASEGIILERFYASSASCAPSRASILTGMYTPRHKVYIPQGYSMFGSGNEDHYLKMRWKVPTPDMDSSFFSFPVSVNHVEPEIESLAELLKKAGYVSSRIGKWHIGDDNQGFDYNSANGEPGFITNIDGDEQRFYADTMVAERMTDAAIDFIQQYKEQPFFLFLSHWEVHTPMAAQKERIKYFEEKAAKLGLTDFNAVYAAEVEALDHSLGRVMKTLSNLGLEENTLLIYTSDNGGLMGQTTNAPLREGKGTFYEGGIRVPFVARWPIVINPGTSSREITIGVDFMPTLAEITNLPLPSKQAVDGLSILPIFENTESILPRQVFFHFPLYLGGNQYNKVLPVYNSDVKLWRAVPSTVIMEGPWKLIYYYEYDNYELFNLDEDLSETHNLAGTLPDKEAELLKHLHQWVKETNAPVPNVPNDLFTLENLN
ncbi:MAG: sulfatase [Cyclobacteriaceae bacterium]|nr:sulfatase [Cyclobacteriaceae bacterium]